MGRAGLVLGMLLVGACGSNVEESNAQACEDYRSAMLSIECGETDLAAQFPETFCDAYAGAKCDMAPYFECLEGSAQCDESGEFLLIDATGCEAEANCG